MKKASFTLTFLISFGCITFSQNLTIGKQVWMTKNLDVSTFRNGDTIPQAKTDKEWEKAGENEQPAWCYYDNNAKNGEKYGKLYNWYAVNDPRGLAPKGWHVPSDKEWTVLTDYLGGEAVAGKKMKSSSGWKDYESKSGNGTNESGFLGLPSGYCYSNGLFYFIGSYCGWWSTTEYSPSSALIRELNYKVEGVGRYGNVKSLGFSVRCVRD